MALVSYVVSGTKPAGTAEGDGMSLYGVSKDARDREVADRLKKVGAIEIRDANRELATGETVFKAQCVACHGVPGIPGAPHLNDAAAWAPRIGQGYATLLEHALKGKGAMPAQGGGDYEDLEIGRAVVYLANAGGAKFRCPNAQLPPRRPMALPQAPHRLPVPPWLHRHLPPKRAPLPSKRAAGASKSRLSAGFFVGVFYE